MSTDSNLDRRAFIAGIGGLGLTATLGLVGCSSGTKSATSKQTALSLLVATDQLISGTEQRLALVFKDKDEFVVPTAKVPLAIGDNPDGPFKETNPGAVFTDAADAPAYFVGRFVFDQPGEYWIEATTDGQGATAPITVVDPAQSKIPHTGDQLVPVATPTRKDRQGVDPICTRDSECPLHEMTITEALDTKKPTAVLFATPAFCTSETCGPVLETLLDQVRDFKDVNFIHVEIYTNRTDRKLTKGVTDYHLRSDPSLFLADGNGVVSERIDGIYGKSELRSGLERISS